MKNKKIIYHIVSKFNLLKEQRLIYELAQSPENFQKSPETIPAENTKEKLTELKQEIENSQYTEALQFFEKLAQNHPYRWSLDEEKKEEVKKLALSGYFSIYKTLVDQKILDGDDFNQEIQLVNRLGDNNLLPLVLKMQAKDLLDRSSFEGAGKEFLVIQEKGLLDTIIFCHDTIGVKFESNAIDAYELLAKLSENQVKVILELFVKINKYHEKMGYKGDSFWEIKSLLYMVGKKGIFYIENILSTLDGQFYRYPQNPEKYKEKAGQPIIYSFSLTDFTQEAYDKYFSLTEPEKKQVKELGQYMIERFDWMDLGNDVHFRGAPYILELSKKTPEYREKLFSRIEELQKKNNVKFKNVDFNSGDGEYHKIIMGMDDDQFQNFIDFVEKFKTTPDFVFTIDRVNDYTRLMKTGAGETALEIWQAIPAFRPTRASQDWLVKVHALPAEQKTAVIKLFKKCTNEGGFSLDYIELKHVIFFIELVQLNKPDLTQAIIRILGKSGNKDIIYILGNNIANPEFQKVLLYLAHGEIKDVKITLGLLNKAIKKDQLAKDIMAELDKRKEAIIILENGLNPETVKQALSLIGKGYLYQFDHTKKNDYLELFKLFPEKLTEEIVRNIDYGSTTGSLAEKMIQTQVPIRLLEEYFFYEENRDRLQIPDQILTEISKQVENGHELPVTMANVQMLGDFVERLSYLQYLSNKRELDNPELSELKINLLDPLQKVFPDKKWDEKATIKDLYLTASQMIKVEISPDEVTDFETFYTISFFYEKSVLTNFQIRDFDLSRFLQGINCELGACDSWFRPDKLESIRTYLGDTIGYQKASNFIFDVGQRFFETNQVSFENLRQFITIGACLKSTDFPYKNHDAENIYILLGNFTLNKVGDFLNDKLGPEQKNGAAVEQELQSKGLSLKQIETKLKEAGMTFDIKETDWDKAKRHLKAGDYGYVWDSGLAKVKKMFSEKPKAVEKISIIKKPTDWQTKDGVKVEAIEFENEEKARIISIDRDKLRATVTMGNNEQRLFSAKQVEEQAGNRQLVAFGTLAFSTTVGEMTELAIKEGEVMGLQINSQGKDALVLTNRKGQLGILDKRELHLQEVYKIAGISPTLPDRILKITERIEDYRLFMKLLQQGEISLASSMMLIKDGVPELSGDAEQKGKRLLIEYKDGRIAMLDSSHNMMTNDAIQLAHASGEVKYAVYMDTGNYDSAFYYEPDKAEPQKLGWRSTEEEISNAIVLALAPERMKLSEVKEPEIVTREDWKARPPKEGADFTKYKEDLKTVLRSIVIHHSAMEKGGGPKGIQDLEMNEMGYDDIAYHYVVGQDGTIYEGRSIIMMGSHAGETKEANEAASKIRSEISDPIEQQKMIDEVRKKDPDYGAIGIVMDGSFEDAPPTEQQISALKNLLAYLKTTYDIPLENIIGHKHVKGQIVESQGLTPIEKCETEGAFCTLCPGHEGGKILEQVKDELPADTEEAKQKLRK